jgi:hypothetical protein
MPGKFLTTSSSIQCPHGGKAVLKAGQSRVKAGGSLVLLKSDVHQVRGCPFTLPGPKPSPCIRIEWSGGTGKVALRGKAALVRSSIGKCFSAENAFQGLAVIGSTQGRAAGR